MAKLDIESPAALGFTRFSDIPADAHTHVEVLLKSMFSGFDLTPEQYWVRLVDGTFEILVQVGPEQLDLINHMKMKQGSSWITAEFLSVGEMLINRQKWQLITIRGVK